MLIISLKHLTHKERLEQLKLPPLKYERARGDIREVYKIMHNNYDSNATVNVSLNKYAATEVINTKITIIHFTITLENILFVHE